MSEYILSCDWGTSFFRLRLAAVQDQQVRGEVVSPEGIAATHDRWKQDSGQMEASRPAGLPDRQAFYRAVLKKQAGALAGNVSVPLEGIPLVISGMASSSLGLVELPYAPLPFSLDGSSALVRKFSATDDFPHDILLISGVRNQLDVMRGEETEMLGLAAEQRIGEGVFIFPGTHSKHLYVAEGAIVDFETFMTGELFHLMTHHGILKESVENSGDNHLEESMLNSFRKGVGQSGARGLLQELFAVRANQLFGYLSRRQNFYYLSGLLIGSELRELIKKQPRHLVLCSGSRLSDLYTLALEEAGWLDKTTFISPEEMDLAATRGHVRIYRNQYLNINKA